MGYLSRSVMGCSSRSSIGYLSRSVMGCLSMPKQVDYMLASLGQHADREACMACLREYLSRSVIGYLNRSVMCYLSRSIIGYLSWSLMG